MNPLESEILTVKELQGYLKIPRPTIYVLAQNGRIPAAKIGRHWRFRRSDVDAWLVSQQGKPIQRRNRVKKEANGPFTT